MKLHLRILIAVSAALLLQSSAPVDAAEPNSPRLQVAADAGWRSMLGDPSGAEATTFADSCWRTVDLPHDWSVEGRPEKGNPSGAGGGFFPAGVGWYRKTFSVPPGWEGGE